MSTRFAAPCFVDRADDHDHQFIARDAALGGVNEIGPLDARKTLERAFGRLAIGMVGERLRPPSAAGDRSGIVRVVAQARVHVLAHALERLLVEARRVDREAQEFGGAVEVLDQRAHAPAPMIAVAVELHLDRLFVQRSVEGLQIEFTRALVEETRDERSQARLALRVLRRASAHRKLERDKRHRVGLDQPQLQAARGDDDFDVDGGIGGRNDEVLLHERFHDFVLLDLCRRSGKSVRRTATRPRS